MARIKSIKRMKRRGAKKPKGFRARAGKTARFSVRKHSKQVIFVPEPDHPVRVPPRKNPSKGESEKS